MAIYTALIARDMSSVVGKTNGLPVGRVFQLCVGDCTTDFDTKQSMKDIFYWKTVELSDGERDIINDAINTPQYDDSEPPVEIVPKKNVDLDCFSGGDITTLSARGTVAPGLGGTITNANFVITNA